MAVCILGNSLTALTLAKVLVNFEIDVDIIFNKKNYKISDSRTIGISRNNVDFFNTNIINIKKLIWNIKTIEIFSENLKKEKLINFKANKNQLFSIVKNQKLQQLLVKDLSKSKFFRTKFKFLLVINTIELKYSTTIIKFISPKIPSI